MMIRVTVWLQFSSSSFIHSLTKLSCTYCCLVSAVVIQDQTVPRDRGALCDI